MIQHIKATLPKGISVNTAMFWELLPETDDIRPELQGRWCLYIEGWPNPGSWGLAITADLPLPIYDHKGRSRMPERRN